MTPDFVVRISAIYFYVASRSPSASGILALPFIRSPSLTPKVNRESFELSKAVNKAVIFVGSLSYANKKLRATAVLTIILSLRSYLLSSRIEVSTPFICVEVASAIALPFSRMTKARASET